MANILLLMLMAVVMIVAAEEKDKNEVTDITKIFSLKWDEYVDGKKVPITVSQTKADVTAKQYQIDSKPQKYTPLPERWKKGSCWATRRPAWIARPTIDSCKDPKKDNVGSVKECCNFVMDEEIGGGIEDFELEKCQRYTRQEYNWKWFQCIPCNYTSTFFTEVFQDDKQYWEQMIDVYKVMYDNMGLTKHRLSELLMTDNSDPKKPKEPALKNGIVQICASYMREQWITNKLINTRENSLTDKERDNLKNFAKPTEGYDHCGIKDHKSPADGIDPVNVPVPSEFEDWADAYKMLNWIGLDYYDGFQIVLIDDISKENPYKETTNTNCFTMAEQKEDVRGSFKYDKFASKAVQNAIGLALTLSTLVLMQI